MKKFFALVLAVAMIMSMAAVSFAADSTVGLTFMGRYKGEDHVFSKKMDLNYGDAAYYLIEIDGDPVSDWEIVEKLKINVDFEMGEELVKSVNLVKKYDDAVKDYNYYVEFATVKKEATADADIVGTLEFSRKAVKDSAYQAGKIDKDANPIDFEFSLFYRDRWNAKDSSQLYVGNWGQDEVVIDWDTNYVLKFESDDEVEFQFGTDPNEGTFTVDVSGQGKMFLNFNTKANEAIAAANPGVKMHFVNFNNAKFNRTGEFTYEMEDGVAAYKVVDGALVAIPGCEYDESDETFTFNTRVLESYVFANAELVNPVVEAPVVEAPAAAPSNPSTGA